MDDLSPADVARYVRQIMVSGVGRDGQAALARATARVGDSPLAKRYAERAGFGAVAPGVPDVASLAPEDVVRTPAARAALAGARATLQQMRRVFDEDVS